MLTFIDIQCPQHTILTQFSLQQSVEHILFPDLSLAGSFVNAAEHLIAIASFPLETYVVPPDFK